ncbi:hypothetical protein [Actinocorallia longicatena]|uniref:Uncharacterized protein n=1 Tax=Actinocorallia longicatena TaxID=111803 RepID=A0ABP6QKU7_9ACTN
MISPKTRVLLATPLLAVAFLATSCSSDNANCSTTSCTVTFDRGVDAKASVLGVDAELVSANGDQVTLKIGGQTLTVPVDADPQPSGNFDVDVQSVTKDQVVVKISLN